MLSSISLPTLLFCTFSLSASLRCLEGADCLQDASCYECEGVACTRIVSYNLEDNREVALTCIPHETRRFGFPSREVHLEAEGCRNTGDRQICVCYGRDYCNSSQIGSIWLLLLLIIVL